MHGGHFEARTRIRFSLAKTQRLGGFTGRGSLGLGGFARDLPPHRAAVIFRAGQMVSRTSAESLVLSGESFLDRRPGGSRRRASGICGFFLLVVLRSLLRTGSACSRARWKKSIPGIAENVFWALRARRSFPRAGCAVPLLSYDRLARGKRVLAHLTALRTARQPQKSYDNSTKQRNRRMTIHAFLPTKGTHRAS